MSTPKRAFKIHGMDCAEEVATLRDVLRNLLVVSGNPAEPL